MDIVILTTIVLVGIVAESLVINRARKMLRRRHSRVYISIVIDDRKGARGRLTGKIASVEKRLKREVKR